MKASNSIRITTTTSEAMASTLIPFGELVPSSANVRRTARSNNIAALAASIEELGVLQNLVVFPNQQGLYEVDAGGRRYEAIKLLVEEGKLPDDFQVPCRVINPRDATAASLAENFMREAMHPADEFEAFLKLTNEGHTIDSIADAFGVTPLVVERRLKLAAAAPELIEEFRENEISTDQLIALCACDDHCRQLEVWNRHKGSWNCEPRYLRQAVLADREIEIMKEPRVAFIGGIEVYQEAGGKVRRDLFSDVNSGFLCDEPLLDKLVVDKLDETAEALRAEGWGWVEVWPRYECVARSRLGIAPSTVVLSENARVKVAELEKERGSLAPQVEEYQGRMDEWSQEERARYLEKYKRLSEIGWELRAIDEANICYAPDVKKNSGAIVAYDHGELRVERGLVRAVDRKAVVEAAGDSNAVTGGRETESAGRNANALSEALRCSLLGHRNLAAQVAVSNRPDVAKILLACWSVKEIRERDYCYGAELLVPTDLKIGERYGLTRTHHAITDEPGKEKEQEFAKACKAAVEHLPTDDGELWDALAGSTSDDLDRLIAFGIARSVSLAPTHVGLTAKLLNTLGFDMASHFQTTAANYLGRVSKPLMVEALAEAGPLDDEDKTALLALKKGKLAETAESRLSGTGWVPSLIRTPTPTPTKSAAPAKKKPRGGRKASSSKASA